MAEKNTTAASLGRIRKAIVAGVTAGVGAIATMILPLNGGRSILEDGLTAAEAGTLAGTFVTAGVTAGYLAWQVPNKPPQHASEDAAVLAAQTEISNLAIAEPSEGEIGAVSFDAPTDEGLPAPGESAAGLPDDDEPARHRA